MDAPEALTSALLSSDVATHGFFGRRGGVSKEIFASLNTGLGSSDAPEAVRENRQRCTAALGLPADSLVTLYQVHSAKVVTVDAPWDGAGPEADAMVTSRPGVALGVLAADCMPWLFIDPEAKIIGAAHAGWRGALGGVLENTVKAMVRLGATPKTIRASVGPALRQRNFEVGLDLYDAFVEKYADAHMHFAPGQRPRQKAIRPCGFWQASARDIERRTH